MIILITQPVAHHSNLWIGLFQGFEFIGLLWQVLLQGVHILETGWFFHGVVFQARPWVKNVVPLVVWWMVLLRAKRANNCIIAKNGYFCSYLTLIGKAVVITPITWDITHKTMVKCPGTAHPKNQMSGHVWPRVAGLLLDSPQLAQLQFRDAWNPNHLWQYYEIVGICRNDLHNSLYHSENSETMVDEGMVPPTLAQWLIQGW